MAFDAATVAFVEGGCALIVGTVGPAGEPHATRGWGLTLLAGEGTTGRLLLAADDTTALANLRAGSAIAITAADVRTLHSMQVKGRALRVEPRTDEDKERAERYIDAFFADVIESDHSSRELLERLVPSEFVACIVTINDVYDQTPGPGAGAPIGVTAP